MFPSNYTLTYLREWPGLAGRAFNLFSPAKIFLKKLLKTVRQNAAFYIYHKKGLP